MMRFSLLVCFFATFALVLNGHGTSALFRRLPSPTSYSEGTELPIMVDSLTSRKGLVPLNYYSIPTCRPSEQEMQLGKVKENIGEILMGNRIMPSPYKITVGAKNTCVAVCSLSYNREGLKRMRKVVDQYYRGHMFLEGLPLVEKSESLLSYQRLRLGYRLGGPQRGVYPPSSILYNHLNFTITYTQMNIDEYYITGFYVTPLSIKDACTGGNGGFVELKGDSLDVVHSYSVNWVEDVDQSVITTRWDVYARASRWAAKKGHWMAILNSMVLLLFLGFLVAVVMTRTVRKELLVYTDVEMAEEAHEETGWKLLRGDVFRTPPYPLVLSGIAGTGSQVVAMSLFSILASFLGVMHPTQRGNLLSGLIFLFCLTSGMSGYVVGRMLKFFRKQSWKNGIMTVTLFPGVLFGVYILSCLINWYKHATTAVPFQILIFIVFLLLAVFLPLALVGLSIGFRAPVIEPPCKVGSIPRAIPEETKTRRRIYILAGGLIPFTAAFVEVVYVLGAFWQGEPFHYFGYLSAILIIIGFVCAEVAVVVTYALLAEEDHNWWWGSVLSSGSCGLFFFGYSLVYLCVALEIRQPLSVILYCLYTFGVSLTISVLTGSIGLFSSTIFVKTIYGAIKAD